MSSSKSHSMLFIEVIGKLDGMWHYQLCCFENLQFSRTVLHKVLS